MKQELQQLLNWVKPTTDLQWANDVKAESLDLKFDSQLVQMKESLGTNLLDAEKRLDRFVRFPDYERYKIENFFENNIKFDKNGLFEGNSLKELVDNEWEQRYELAQWEVGKIKQSLERIAKEQELRKSGFLQVLGIKDRAETFKPNSRVRVPIGTTYYVDPVNGLATHSGTKLDGTIDSTADTTHFVDDALTGADDYINGGYFFNVTRGIGAQVTDFVALTDTVTLGSAIAGMTAGDVYYILDSWKILDTFTEAARSAGDRCVVKRIAVDCANASTLLQTSAGTMVAPIVLEADYDDEYHTKTTLIPTATLVFGSKTVIFSSTVAAVLAAGDWIYVDGDDVRDFAYEVSTVSTVTVTLFLPYKGNQAGAGKTVYNIQDNSLWGTAASAYNWSWSKSCWKVQGFTHLSTATNSISLTGCTYNHFKDCKITPGTNDRCINFLDNRFFLFAEKCYFLGSYGVAPSTADAFGTIIMKDCLQSSYMIGGNNINYAKVIIKESESTHATQIGTSTHWQDWYIRNMKMPADDNGVDPYITDTGEIHYEDFFNTLGDTRILMQQFGSSINTDYIFQSEEGTVRVGGATRSIKVSPTVLMGNAWEFSKLCLFEIPIYATTDSKTYTIYFNLPDANFTTDPTAGELYLEFEAWGHATNKWRKITKSTGTIIGDGTWRALTITVAPALSGMAYLRCYYAKTKEAESNIFYVDPLPVIS